MLTDRKKIVAQPQNTVVSRNRSKGFEHISRFFFLSLFSLSRSRILGTPPSGESKRNKEWETKTLFITISLAVFVFLRVQLRFVFAWARNLTQSHETLRVCIRGGSRRFHGICLQFPCSSFRYQHRLNDSFDYSAKMNRFRTSKFRNAAPKIPKKEVGFKVLDEFTFA